MHDRILRISQVCEKLSISRTTLHFLPKKDPTFPKKIQLSQRAVGYLEKDIDDWIVSRISKSEE